jgi:hypothetical protein
LEQTSRIRAAQIDAREIRYTKGTEAMTAEIVIPSWIVYLYRQGIEIARNRVYKELAADYVAKQYALDPSSCSTLVACGRVVLNRTDYLVLTRDERKTRFDPLWQHNEYGAFDSLANAVKYWNAKVQSDHTSLPPLKVMKEGQ